MVCLGPRKKEKKANGTEERGIKKTSKLKSPKAINGSVASKKTTPRSSIDSHLPKPANPRASILSTTKKSPPPSRPTSVASTVKTKTTRPSLASSMRATAATAVKATAATAARATAKGTAKTSKTTAATTATTKAAATASKATTKETTATAAAAATKRFPISEMKEEVKGLKAKNEENLKLIADQQAELERLKRQLQEQQEHEVKQEELTLKEREIEELKNKQQELSLREKEVEELRSRLEQLNTAPPSIVVQSDKEEELAEKQRLLEQKEAELEEQRRLFNEKAPEVDQVVLQLEELKSQASFHQLANKEKELEELRSLIKDNQAVEKEEDKEEALRKIEDLNKQLEIQKKTHEESLRLHEQALAEKDQLLKEQQVAIQSLEENHEEELRKLKTAQSFSILALKKKHKDDKLELERQLEETRKEAEKNPAEDAINDHLEKILQEFEQQEHTFAVQIQDLEQSHQSELDHLQNNQKDQMNQLKKSQGQNRESWTERYLPTQAVSWPKPNNLPKLRPTPSLVESKSKTLLRVLGNLPDYQKPEPILTPLDPKKVQIYYSSVSANSVIKRNQEQIQQLLQSNGIKFNLVDVASSESARQYAKRANNNGSTQGRIKEFPQIFVGGEYRGQFNDLVEAIDNEQLDELLRPAKERQFTEEEKAAIRKAELNEELNQEKMMLPPIPATLPKLKPVNKVKPMKEYDEDEELLKMIELELKEGKELDLDNL
ncbi:hypothetical protein G6F62_005374 [Rhizopus arrhizus]|uniref:Glutaredoxin domain-containing protein n=1 Tax=Rhizopus oryzae TaxID=64495 RepID=A0A9P7BR97_RHIOR|nr:hypothetical protein G6F23_008515 [Rhizopus arrhizus]KAG0757955.1 hypothetical protein G6F24_010133 [Rhizopus arrhizus]KAG0788774.1 hypothetical protein G6F21_006978 [Rhizopus arrhizus]KAG0819053.1 hypothetical protein G6F20_001073 [Rhizopus arrhizus]KAG0827934.1 hypothetical protein G6F19_008508 [Rhizopus arrhizus]